ncbi:MAG TPA: substrate-binding domain-containing protein [Acetobacteraceae bacterium]|nr:substrate-binding domain-containing protein [Acetobacteraceae bacterium]
MNLSRRWLWAAALAVASIPVGTVGSRAAGKTYQIYLSNNFVGNDWRQQMERVAQVAAGKEPFKGHVALHIENADSTVQAQINSLNNIIRTRPDAILVDAASDTALNPTITKACNAGIVVISFDQTVTAPCAYAVASDWNMIPAVLAEWMAHELNGKGDVLVDRGLAGAPISKQISDGYEKVLQQNPGIHAVGYFDGQYALGPEQQGVASLLAAHPKIDGILTQGYGTGALKALQDAGRPVVPFTAFSYNGSAVACAQTPGAHCILGANPAWLSAEALKLAVSILDTGKKPAEREQMVRADFLTSDPFTSKLYPQAKMEKIEIGKNAFPNLPPGLTLPVSPHWMTITAEEAAGK